MRNKRHTRWVRWLALLLCLCFLPQPPARATNRCVNPTGAKGCFTSIQAAIDASSAGDVIQVAEGTYVEDVTLKAGVQVIGAGAGLSVIQGTGGVSSLRAPVVQAIGSHISRDTLLQGFTLTGGQANVTIISFGGGVLTHEGASPTIKDNLITGNRATLGGGIAIFGGSPLIENNSITGNSSVDAGGVYVDSSSAVLSGNQIGNNQATEGAATGGGQGGGIVVINYASPLVSGNTILGNSSSCDGGGIVVQHYATPAIVDNAIHNNQAIGREPCGVAGGIKYFDHAGGTFEGNLVDGNIGPSSGGGVYIEGNSAPVIDGNRIFNNDGGKRGGGMVVSLGSQPKITNNEIAHNRASEHGAGIFVHSTSPEIRNNTIVFNGSDSAGGGIIIYAAGAQPTIVNNIIAHNYYGLIRSADASGGLQDFNDVWNNVINYHNVPAGPHDLSADPLFVNPAGDNYRLKAGSPAIDAGTNLGAPTWDLEEFPRPVDGDGDGNAQTDMGAHELSAAMYLFPSHLVIWHDPYDLGESGAGAIVKALKIENVGNVSFRYTVALPQNPPFPIQATSLLSGSLLPLESQDFHFNVDGSNLLVGTYSASLTVTATSDGDSPVRGSPATVQVQVVVGPHLITYLPLAFRP